LITPYGTELFVERGLIAAAGTTIWVSQGYYRIESVEQDDAPTGEVQIMAKDRMLGIVEARLTAPVQFVDQSTVTNVMDQLIPEVYPDATIEYDFAAAATTFPGNHIAEEGRFEFIDDMVRAIGKIWYWDYRGILVVKSAPDSRQPVWSVNAGEGGVLVKMARERNREKAYNAVVVNGEQAGTDQPPVRAVVYDMAPSSPTYWHGRFGKKPMFYSSSFIHTNDQAVITAAEMLKRRLGLPYSVTFAAVANPALEPLDPIELRYSGTERTEHHVIDNLVMPLEAAGAMTATTRDLTVVGLASEVS